MAFCARTMVVITRYYKATSKGGFFACSFADSRLEHWQGISQIMIFCPSGAIVGRADAVII
jgi:hypothetical protein